MKEKEIINNIKSRLGIESLNDMQCRMSQCRSQSIVLLSPTGSGKTVAFTIPMLKSLKEPSHSVQTVVIAPSRELVQQIASVVRQVATGYKTVALYGGHSMIDEARSLSVPPDIVIATPGRLLDHINRNNIDLSSVATLVLDEYDKSLELGFQDEMRRVVRAMGHFRMVILTSATKIDRMPSFIPMRNPETIDFTAQDVSVRERMDVVEVQCPVRDKIDMAIDLLKSLPDGKVIVFANHRESVERIYQMMRKAHLPVGLYHGGLEQWEREKAIDMLNNGSTPILVSTDLGSRGLDIDAVQAVVHYHLPPSAESWTHRNGRTARMGATGTVYVITADGETVQEYIECDRKYVPTGQNVNPIKAHWATLHFNAGKKEKISRGDIVGFLINKGRLEQSEIGRIAVKDHAALVAVPVDKVREIIDAIAPHKIKNTRVRVTVVS